MGKSRSAARVERARSRLRAKGLRPVQIWVPDTRAPGFAAELARQCQAEATWLQTPEGQRDMAFWDEAAAEAWETERES